MLSLVRPRYFVPVHGEYRHLALHQRVAERVTRGAERPVDVMLIENGDVLQFDGEGASVTGKAPTGRVLIDDTRVGEVADEVLRDRRHLAVDGIVLPVVAVRKQDGELVGLAGDHHARRRRRSGERGAAGRRGASARGRHRRAERGRAHGSRTAARDDPGRNATVLSKTDGAAAAGAARRHGDLITRGDHFHPVPSRQRVHRRCALCGGADLADRARHARAERSGVVLHRRRRACGGELRRPRRRVPVARRRCRCSATRRSWCRRCSPSRAGTSSGAASSMPPTRRSIGAGLFFACLSALLALVVGNTELNGRTFRAGGYVGEWIAGICSAYLNRPGAIIVVLTLLTLAVIMATQFSFGRAFAAGIQGGTGLSSRGLGVVSRVARGTSPRSRAPRGDREAHEEERRGRGARKPAPPSQPGAPRGRSAKREAVEEVEDEPEDRRASRLLRAGVRPPRRRRQLPRRARASARAW